MRFPRNRHSAVLLGNGKVLVVGGSADIQDPMSAELYDPATGVVQPDVVNDTRAPRASAADAERRVDTGRHYRRYLQFRELFVCVVKDSSGGRLGEHRLQRGFRAARLLCWAESFTPTSGSPTPTFDPLTNAFAAIGELIWPRSGATATELQDGRVLLFGGGADGRYPDRAEIIDPTTRNISALTSIGSGRVFHTATPLPDGRVLIAGGLGYSTSGTSTAEAQPFLFVP